MRSVQTSKGTPCMELLSVHLSVCYLNRWDRAPFNSALENLTKKKKSARSHFQPYWFAWLQTIHLRIWFSTDTTVDQVSVKFFVTSCSLYELASRKLHRTAKNAVMQYTLSSLVLSFTGFFLFFHGGFNPVLRFCRYIGISNYVSVVQYLLLPLEAVCTSC